MDNPKPLVVRHDAATREVEFNERFLAFAAHWKFRPRACAPYRARTKGKDECPLSDIGAGWPRPILRPYRATASRS